MKDGELRDEAPGGQEQTRGASQRVVLGCGWLDGSFLTKAVLSRRETSPSPAGVYLPLPNKSGAPLGCRARVVGRPEAGLSALANSRSCVLVNLEKD